MASKKKRRKKEPKIEPFPAEHCSYRIGCVCARCLVDAGRFDPHTGEFVI